MEHKIHRVTSFSVIGPYTLRITFEDSSSREIDFSSILHGNLYGPLRDERLFSQVELDPEVHTLVWPNGADFDPETLYHWPRYAGAMQDLARRGELITHGQPDLRRPTPIG